MTLHPKIDAAGSAPLASHWDAVVIGSGAGGATAAWSLARHGAQVLVVEAGDFLKPGELKDGDPVGRFMYEVIGGPDGAMTFVGGKTKFYGGALYRMRESDFTHTGPDGERSWPIGYETLEPYYEEAERLYRVHGAAEGDPSEPRRASPFPHAPLPHEPRVQQMIDRLNRTGTPTAPVPRGLDYGEGGKCVLCATCDTYFCQREAKMDAEIAALRPAMATGNVQLLTNTECLKVLTSPDGKRATGVVLRGADGEQTVTADAVLVAAGIPETAKLLRRSRTDQHPEGLGGNGGALGKYLSGHSVGYVFALCSLSKLPPMHSKTFAINAFHDGAPGWDGQLGVIQAVGQIPFWETASGPMKIVARIVGERAMTFFYSTEAHPTRESGFVWDGDEIKAKVEPTHDMAAFERLRTLAVERFGKAGYRVLARRRPPYLWHESGTARMGEDPASSVVDPDCQVHGINGLYVVDQSAPPTAGRVNTSLTIMALALRAGDHIAGLKSKAKARRAAAPA